MTKLTQEQLNSLSPEVRAIVEAQQTALATVKTQGYIVSTENGMRFSLKVSEKTKAVSIYGFGRFPVTIYPKQLLALLDGAAQVRSFIKDNTANLSWEQTAEQKAERKAANLAALAAKSNVG